MTTVPVRRHNHVRRLASDRAFDGVLYTIAAILTLTALYPMYFIIIASISDPSLVAQGKILLLPRGVTLEGYEHLASMKNLWVGYGNTILYTIAGTAIMLVVNIPVAYVLSRYTAMPILLLYACCQSLEIIKCIIGTVMVKKGIWINNIVADKKGEV